MVPAPVVRFRNQSLARSTAYTMKKSAKIFGIRTLAFSVPGRTARFTYDAGIHVAHLHHARWLDVKALHDHPGDRAPLD